ncbi:OLC1v1017579C1 [Oldenlandia corymbosa var. corymbosa]|uniref:OLC1v1017579C1 n=1 Tax=Oldenlandia corymbosa var. corymbosa TaxID=529605 RepID=A0AAV1E9R6_OLDCO|nr:OLC1v1017579C1 [Oldenlandia corymbosa var. corymbosa]
MELHQVLHMKGGDDISSYAKNSSFPKTVATKSRHILEGSIKELCRGINMKDLLYGKCWIRMAELGCGSGSNTLTTIKSFIEILDKEFYHNNNLNSSRVEVDDATALPSVEILLNDLVSNDFNLIFKSLPKFYQQLEKLGLRRLPGSCFVSAVPGSFYGRLFPDNSIHFFHSSQSLHWLSQVPAKLMTENGLSLNKGNVHIGNTSPPAVHDAYLEQFKSDFSTFLRRRSIEMASPGRMFFILCSDTPGSVGFRYLDQTLNDMVKEGIIEEKALDGFNIPMYEPTMEEMRWIIEEEGSFEVNQIETIRWNKDDDVKNMDQDPVREMYVRVTRAVFGSIIESHFGVGIMDDLFRRLAKNISECVENFIWIQDSLAVSLVKKD